MRAPIRSTTRYLRSADDVTSQLWIYYRDTWAAKAKREPFADDYNRVSIPVSIEVFFAGDDVKEQFGSRLRISAGLTYIVDSRWPADINLIIQESRDTESGDLQHRRPRLAQ